MPVTRRGALAGLAAPLLVSRRSRAQAFYWNLNDRTRRFTAKVQPRMRNGLYPSTNHASAYSGTLHCLKAVQAVGGPVKVRSGKAVAAQMQLMPTDDDALGAGRVREDRRKIHNAYLFEVKAPGQNKGEWDLYSLLDTILAGQAFRPVAEGGCVMP